MAAGRRPKPGSVEVPESLRDFGRWQHEGEAGSRWLAALPDTVVEWGDRWNLEVDGRPMHGYNSLVVPVRRDSEPLATEGDLARPSTGGAGTGAAPVGRP